jgi:integration host factor subunit alpha
MTQTKTDLVKGVIEEVHLKNPKKQRQQFLFPELDYAILTKKLATEYVDALFEIMKQTLEKGEHVLISGFGKFQVKFKWARKGRNPKTGEDIILNSRRIVTFQCSSKLKGKINRREDG